MTKLAKNSQTGVARALREAKRTVTDARYAVIGSPIAHSRSPRIHRAAYSELGLEWSYESFDVSETRFSQFLEGLDESWRGLSVTMPLKRVAFARAAKRDDYASQTGVANTLVRTPEGWSGYNTDVPGAISVIEHMRLGAHESALVFGAGATALSLLAALEHLGFHHVTIFARRAEQLAQAKAFASGFSFSVDAVQLSPSTSDSLHERVASHSLLLNTLPGAASAELGISAEHIHSTVLFDVNYDPWPSPLCQLWQSVGTECADGLDLLVQQALLQIRIFRYGNPSQQLPNEADVVEVMRRASVEG